MENIQRGFIWEIEYIKIQKSKLWYTAFDTEKVLGYGNHVIIGYDDFQCLAIERFLLR